MVPLYDQIWTLVTLITNINIYIYIYIYIYEHTITKLKFQHILMVKNTCCTYAQMFNLSSNIIFKSWNQFLSVITNNHSRPKMKWHLATAAHFKPLIFIKYWYTTISAIAASPLSNEPLTHTERCMMDAMTLKNAPQRGSHGYKYIKWINCVPGDNK